MEFIVDIPKAKELQKYMDGNVAALQEIIDEINDATPTLKKALGDDYERIYNVVKGIHDNCTEARDAINALSKKTVDYIEKVGEVRRIING